jgi:branched-chain amino acid transport system permease protein
LGVPIGRVQTIVWIVTTVFAFVTLFLRIGVAGIPIGSDLGALGVIVLVRGLTAAVIGRLDDLPRISAAAIGIGIVDQAIVYDTGRDLYVYPVMFVIVVVALALERIRRGSRVEQQAVSSWEAAREMRRIPTELRTLPEVVFGVGGLLLAVAVFVLTLPVWMSNSDLFIATTTATMAIIAVSLVVLTGWAGHVSLGQLAFAGIGGAVGGWITQTAGWDLGFALVGGGAVAGATAVIVGIPAARAGGLTLAVTTLTLASASLYWLVNPEFFPWVPRGPFRTTPELFGGLEITTERSFYFLTLAVLAVSVAMAYGLRRSRTGRVLIALRDNTRAAEAYGINATRTMLVAFGFSGFLAGVAGVLFVHHARVLEDSLLNHPFSAAESIRVFATVVIGGLGSIPGAILGAVYVYSTRYYLPYEWRFLATGVGLLLMLLILPGGLGAALAEARDAGLRFVARRRRLLVPSLLADRRVEEVEVTPAMAAAVAEAVERPEVGEVAEMHQ